MFTGLVQAIGTVRGVGKQLDIEVVLQQLPKQGDSVAIDGCCLTHLGGHSLCFDLGDETLARTRFADLRIGDHVNVECALRVGDPVGGHFVLGHVDDVTELIGTTPGDVGVHYRFRLPRLGANLVANKGCIAINGVSLTVIEPSRDEFGVWLVPHTLESTTLASLVPGERVNVEYDLVARHIARLWDLCGPPSPPAS